MPPANGGACVRVEHVGLSFRRYGQKHPTFKQAAIDALFGRGRGGGTWTMFEDLDLHVEHGQRLGIVGPNGSGKSTLLKLISGVYPPTSGRITIAGRVAPLLELGAGFNPELSGLENIYLNGAMLGFGPREMAAKADGILDFAGVRDAAGTPVKYYSTGMTLRLGFAIATDVDPEILLVDEVLSAGDAEFVTRAKERMQRLVDASHIVMIVSHDLVLITQLCNRAIWLEAGRIVVDGPPNNVCHAYYRHSQGLPMDETLREYHALLPASGG